MSGINKVILIGNLGADPETKYAQNGTPITNLRLATSETWKDKQTNERREKTEWHRCVAFGRVAEIAGEYLRKGSKVYVEGSIETSTYEKDGETRYSTQIKIRDLQMLDSRADGGGSQGGSQGGGSQGGSQSNNQGGGRRRPAQSQQSDAADDFDDDIPF